jgi:CRP-like cAMP-binding protein
VPLWRSRSSKIALLQQVPLFEGLSQRQLEQIGRLTDEVEVPAGKRLATAGDVGRELFVIVEGQASVTTARARTVRLGPGDFLGEMSLIDGEPRSANVVAATPMRLLVVAHRDFWQLLDAAPPLARRIMRTLSRRLRDAERTVTA